MNYSKRPKFLINLKKSAKMKNLTILQNSFTNKVAALLLAIYCLHFIHLTCASLIVNTIGDYSIGANMSLICKTNETSAKLWWSSNENNLTSKEIIEPKGSSQAILNIANTSLKHFKNYTCNSLLPSGSSLNFTQFFAFTVDPYVNIDSSKTIKNGQNVELVCEVNGYPLYNNDDDIRWTFKSHYLINTSDIEIINERPSLTKMRSSIKIHNVSRQNNGTYFCHSGNLLKNSSKIVVLSKPKIDLGLIKEAGKSKIFLNWTIDDGNSPITDLILKYNSADKKEMTINLNTSANKYLITELIPSTNYTNFKLEAKNEMGSITKDYIETIKTLEEDPKLIPEMSIKGVTSDTVTLGWPTDKKDEYYHYFNVTVINRRKLKALYYIALENEYLVENLKPGTEYAFQVQACSSFTEKCDPDSKSVSGTTMDGKASAPRNITIDCIYDDKSQAYTVKTTWDEPEDTHGQIMEYLVSLNGHAIFIDERGRDTEERMGPFKQTIPSRYKKFEFNNQPPNTEYDISICAKTRTRVCGQSGFSSKCKTPPSGPAKERLSRTTWKTVQRNNSDNHIFFMVNLPSISQRNGTICCYRVVVVRLGSRSMEDVDRIPPEKTTILTYDQAHNSSSGGAYIAEIIDSNSFNEPVVIGDEKQTGSDKHSSCQKCWPDLEIANGLTGNYRKTHHFPKNDIEENKRHRKRHASQPLLTTNQNDVHDGKLHPDSTYSGYLEAFIISDRPEKLKFQSKYFPPLQPRQADPAESFGMAIIGTLLLAFIVVLMSLTCVLRWRRKEPGDEQEYGLSHSIQQWCRRLRGQHIIPSNDLHVFPSISAEEMANAFIERHKDSDLGFQQEFERLPDRFHDRTTSASDQKENCGKNRYPDIKAYDQTRVKLLTLDGIVGSDYINANMVVGYKERKKFVCAQGPMDSTMTDWWRLIWEQHIHLVLMLTNIEEYNKTKCARYWPNESEGSFTYENIGITVTHMAERRFSDYLVRNLKISKARVNGTGEEERQIIQYHYLVWKDFVAPEHPVGIIRFIKRYNEIYSPEKGPILVHCSAGVGRTGTLVALDSLLQQLSEEGTAPIFNTIVDLRHQRNYLVQSLKQYIFTYRTLLEMCQFGDTEILVADLKSTLEKIKEVSEGQEISPLEAEFNKLSQPQVIEDRKPMSIGTSEENKHRNRHSNVIPYDRSRVILQPIPGPNKEICMYINASFIEGYDNTEQFIISQDPLDNTIGDFWRMIVEQNIRGVVMLSEVGEEKSPRYWPEKDQETSHDYIKVKYMQCQSFPNYYRREFSVTNNRTEDSTLVTQFQYNGWPVGDGEVPQSTRGIVELVDTIFKHKDSLEKSTAPILVHCSAGAERSCIFVALAILAQQVTNESRVDVFSVVRKLRSQRQGLFQNFAQYDFVYRGLVTYAELHMTNGNPTL